MQPKGGDVVDVLGTHLESCGRRLSQGSPALGEANRDSEPQWRLRRAGPGSLDYPPAMHLAAPHLPLLLARHSPAPFHPAPAPQAVPNQ